MRLFVALDLPWDLRQRAGDAGRRRHSGCALGAAGELSPDAALHRRDAAPSWRRRSTTRWLALKARGFSLTLAGVGTFAKGGRSTALWVGVERNPQLDHLRSKIETALQRCGLEPERRRFQPHLTLARLDNAGGGEAGGVRAGA